jgi:hypothetical protein
MDLHGFRAQTEGGRDLLVGLARGDELEDLALACAERRESSASLLAASDDDRNRENTDTGTVPTKATRVPATRTRMRRFWLTSDRR